MDIGIVTSFYNHYDRFLPQWSESISELNTKPSAVTIVVSGPDFTQSNINKSIEILQSCGLNPTVFYLTEHKGMGHARNEAVRLTNTAWIQYLDVDDVILKDALDIYSKYENRADVISGGLKITGDKSGKDLIFTNASRKAALAGDHVCCSHAVYKKSLWEKRPYITINDYVEQPLWLGFAQIGAEFVGTSEICTVYNTRKDGHNMSMTDEERRYARAQKEHFLKSGVKDEVIKTPIYYNYCKTERGNFGDELAPIILGWIADRPIEYVSYAEKNKLLLVGSIMTRWKENDVIWGTGTMYDKDITAPKGVKILAVRGPLSKQKIKGAEVPEIYGDPALLMPKIYTPKSIGRRYKVGIIPHYVDQNRFIIDDSSMLVIDVGDHPFKIIDQINSCDVIVSSSLHGIIVAEAYGVPAVWLQVSDKVLGGNHKFNDYFLSTGREVRNPIRVVDFTVNSKMIKNIAQAPLPKPTINTDPLEAAFRNYFKLNF